MFALFVLACLACYVIILFGRTAGAAVDMANEDASIRKEGREIMSGCLWRIFVFFAVFYLLNR